MRNSNRTRQATSVTLTIALLFVSIGSASGASRCVHPAGAGGCFSTIQAAEDVSGAHDTIVLRPGRYFENVEVDVLNLRITGPATAILSPGDDGLTATPNMGVGLKIMSNNVLLQGFSIHNGYTDQIELADYVKGTRIIGLTSRNSGDEFLYGGLQNDNTQVKNCIIHAPDDEGVDITGDHFVFHNNFFSSGDDSGVYVDGDNARVTYNRFFGTDSYAVDIDGDYATVTSNKVDASYYGIYADGDKAYIAFNTVRASNDYGIEVSGDGAHIYKNKIYGTEYEAIYVYGDTAFIQANVMADVAGGVYVYGSMPRVEHNQVTNYFDEDGIYVDCDGSSNTCTGAKVKYNRVTNGAYDYAFDIDAESGVLILHGNTVFNSEYGGFDLRINDAKVTNNRAEYIGDDYECFEIDGDDNEIRGNTGKWCSGDAFTLDGNDNDMVRNWALKSGENGFVVEDGSNRNLLRGNTAKDNVLMGFLIEDGVSPAGMTTLRYNWAKLNQSDLCDDGTGTAFISNTFGSVLSVPSGNAVRDCPTY